MSYSTDGWDFIYNLKVTKANSELDTNFKKNVSFYTDIAKKIAFESEEKSGFNNKIKANIIQGIGEIYNQNENPLLAVRSFENLTPQVPLNEFIRDYLPVFVFNTLSFKNTDPSKNIRIILRYKLILIALKKLQLSSSLRVVK